MAINPEELADKIETICDLILHEVIEPVVRAQVDCANIFLADINCYTFGNQDMNEIILMNLYARFCLPSMDEDEFVPLIDACTPLAAVALYIIFEGENYD